MKIICKASPIKNVFEKWVVPNKEFIAILSILLVMRYRELSKKSLNHHRFKNDQRHLLVIIYRNEFTEYIL